MTESHFRSIIKGISWRIVGTIDTMIISFFLTGHLHMALKIGVTEVLTKVFLYYLHERVWIYGLKGKDQTPGNIICKGSNLEDSWNYRHYAVRLVLFGQCDDWS
jgi:uncharacterized membrane protein